jgi:hypothetical protein
MKTNIGVLVIVCLLNNLFAYPTDKLVLSDDDDDSSAVIDESLQTKNDEEILLLPNEINKNCCKFNIYLTTKISI